MSFNGWTNRQTWNVALWIQNDEALYDLARVCSDYEQFRDILREGAEAPIAYQTPDGIPWHDSAINVEELNEIDGLFAGKAS
jgi:hypothetical protein